MTLTCTNVRLLSCCSAVCESGVTARVDGTDVRVRAPSLLLMILLYENQIGIILPAMVWWYEVPRVCVRRMTHTYVRILEKKSVFLLFSCETRGRCMTYDSYLRTCTRKENRILALLL